MVLTDLMMPVMNGRALVHALKKMAPTLPVLVYSATERSAQMSIYFWLIWRIEFESVKTEVGVLR